MQRERSLREKLGRERDVLAGEVLGLRQQLEVNRQKVHLCVITPAHPVT